MRYRGPTQTYWIIGDTEKEGRKIVEIKVSEGQALNFFWSQSRAFWLCLIFLEPEPSFLALIIFFWSQSRTFWLCLFFFGARAELFGSDYFFLEPEPSFLALVIFFGARAGLLALNFYFGACHGA